MATFNYTAITENGKKKRGIVQADGEKSARTAIRSLNLTPINVEIFKEREANQSWFQLNRFKLSTHELALVSRQLSTFILANIPLDETLQACAENTDSRKIKILFLNIKTKVLEGSSLAQSMEDHSNVFPDIFISTISAGEKSGGLGKVLNRLADHIEASAEFKKNIGSALVYPCILIVISLLIIIGLMTYIVPDILSVFTEAGQSLPPLTLALMSFSNFISDYGILVLCGLTVFNITIIQIFKLPKINILKDKILINTPLIKKNIQTYNAVRYTSTLHILFSSGVPLTDSMTTATAVVPNKYIRQQLTQASKQVKEGKSLASSLKLVKGFPSIFVHMVRSGEKSGELSSLMEKVSTSQENELQRKVTTLLGLLEPTTLVIMGGIVLIIVLAILMPILNMNQLII